MSDRMTSREIEDVLSSIRRLVSEETRMPPRQEPAGRAQPALAEKLVLTPDFRIADPVAAPVVVDEVEEEADDGWPTGDGRLGARIAVLEAAVAQRADEWEPDGSEAPLTFVHHPTVAPEAPETGTKAEHRDHAAQPEIADDPLPEVEATPSDPQDWQPEAVPTEAAPEPEAVPEAVTTANQSLEPLEWQDEPREAAPPPHAAAEVEDALFDEDGGDDLLDEEVLRDMIREIIRQELQGALGERITRNVRKLVRAEINRAMASKAFE
jgi:cell pole-organizing protein PopZ